MQMMELNEALMDAKMEEDEVSLTKVKQAIHHFQLTQIVSLKKEWYTLKISYS